MKKKQIIAFVFLAVGLCSAQLALPGPIPNDTVTGTTGDKLVKYNITASATSAIITSHLDTSGAIGVCSLSSKSCGISGAASIITTGQASLVIENATTANDLVIQSPTNDGQGRDIGTTCPNNGQQVVGTIFGAGGAAGTYKVHLRRDLCITPASSSLLNSQGPLTAVTGTGAAANLYTFSIPGNTMNTISCVRVFVGFQHTTGTAATTYVWSYGGTTFTSAATAGTNPAQSYLLVCNNGATNSQFIGAFVGFDVGTSLFAAQYGTSAVDTTAAQTVSFQFNVAGTDAVTPKFWTVESVH